MSTYPDYSGLPNYGGRTVAPSRPVYRPWPRAVLATAIGLVISLVVGFVAGLLGLVWAVSGSARPTRASSRCWSWRWPSRSC